MTVAIIQARMGSSRLPGKVLLDIVGVPMLGHVVTRARRASTLDHVLVATSRAAPDNPIVEFCSARGIDCFRGSEEDVLDRYHSAAASAGADVVVRLTADCPLLDADVIDEVVGVFREGGADYVANILRCTYPDGLDTEVFSRAALERAWGEARLRSEREHVTLYLRKHPDRFRQRNVTADHDWSALRWTVDEPRDLEFVRAVYNKLGTMDFGWRDVLALLDADPALTELNAGIERNAGLRKSLREDGVVE